MVLNPQLLRYEFKSLFVGSSVTTRYLDYKYESCHKITKCPCCINIALLILTVVLFVDTHHDWVPYLGPLLPLDDEDDPWTMAKSIPQILAW